LGAKQNNHAVLVHCVAGISRSGAVAQFAIDYLGFEDVMLKQHARNKKVWRLPNAGVLKALRLAYQGETDYDAIFANSVTE
jgi:protein-tyrosine phosphatase